MKTTASNESSSPWKPGEKAARIPSGRSAHVRRLQRNVSVFLRKQSLQQSSLSGLPWAADDHDRKLPGGALDHALEGAGNVDVLTRHVYNYAF